METQQLINEVAELEHQLDIAQIAILGLELKVQPKVETISNLIEIQRSL